MSYLKHKVPSELGELIDGDTTGGNVTLGSTALSGHIIPTANAQYDLGNAEYKIRHLFLSDNSLWVGDKHKISISNGEIALNRRNDAVVPMGIASEGGNEADALAFTGKTMLSDLTLTDWEAYLQHLTGDPTKQVIDVFDDSADFMPENHKDPEISFSYTQQTDMVPEPFQVFDFDPNIVWGGRLMVYITMTGGGVGLVEYLFAADPTTATIDQVGITGPDILDMPVIEWDAAVGTWKISLMTKGDQNSGTGFTGKLVASLISGV